jgi:DNA repair exonuclease SbcCD ATPase subunit
MAKAKTTPDNTNNYWYEMQILPTQTITKEQEKSIIAKIAKKYNVPPAKVRFTTKKVYPDGEAVKDTALNAEMINNIKDPKFQQELFKQYIEQNGVKEYNWEEILNIDSRVNSLINYDTYEKSRRFVLRYAKWSNFLSYGKDNFFDFTKLSGLVHLKGDPANKSGKSTFAYDLIHFALFGKTRSGKADKFSEMFNNYLPDERELSVEIGITIDGENYMIRRTLTKPDPKKKTKTIGNSVAYFRVNGDGSSEELNDSDNMQGVSTTKTTKAIKEAIGSEEDFDRIISANAKDLDELISMKDTDRGRVLSRWIGLLPLEDKEVKAKDMWAKTCVGRLCDVYNRESLKTEIDTLTEENQASALTIENNKIKIQEAKERKESDSKSKDVLLSSKQKVDDELLNVDVTTIETRMKKVVEDGKKNNDSLAALEKEVAEIGEVEYSDNEYKSLSSKKDALTNEIAAVKAGMANKKKEAQALANDEYCPTCHQKWPNKDNSKAIAKLQEEYAEDYKKGVELKAQKDEIEAAMNALEDAREKYLSKAQKEIKIGALKNKRTTLLTEYSKLKKIADDYKDNKDIILKNNEIDTQVNVLKANIEAYDRVIRSLESESVAAQKDIDSNNETIREKESYIKRIEQEIELEKTWRLYLQMVGKDGIAKMVLRATIPTINQELDKLLCDVTDFKVEVEVTEKNDIEFWLIRDGVKTRLAGGSGLERTQAALALRVVLANMSNLSRPPFIVLDEILGSVAAENYDDMKRLYDKIVLEYDFVLHICHIDLDWYDKTVTCTKTNNISTISVD